MTSRRDLLRILAGASGVALLSGCVRTPPAATPSASASAATDLAMPHRIFAVATDPWSLPAWSTAMQVTPHGIMEFEAFSRNGTLENHFARAIAEGVTSFVVTWEPWQPVDVSLGKHAQYQPQPKYSNAAIAGGALDDYLIRFARSVAAAKSLTVYIRYAHEMNGDWYPWSHDPAGYVAAWRHIVNVFRREGATNAKFVFSVHPMIYLDETAWKKTVAPFWPGTDYVDQIGATIINFGGRKTYTIPEFSSRLAALHQQYPKPMLLTEVDTAAEGRVSWLAALRNWVATTPYLSGVVWSQSSQSRGAAQLGGIVGDMNWDVTTDMIARPVLQALVHDLQRDS